MLHPHLRPHLAYVGLKFTSIPNKPAAGVGCLSLRSFNEFIFALCELLTPVKQRLGRYFTLEQHMNILNKLWMCLMASFTKEPAESI